MAGSGNERRHVLLGFGAFGVFWGAWGAATTRHLYAHVETIWQWLDAGLGLPEQGARFAQGEVTLEQAAEMGCRTCASPGGGCQFLGTAATSQVMGDAPTSAPPAAPMPTALSQPQPSL